MTGDNFRFFIDMPISFTVFVPLGLPFVLVTFFKLIVLKFDSSES